MATSATQGSDCIHHYHVIMTFSCLFGGPRLFGLVLVWGLVLVLGLLLVWGLVSVLHLTVQLQLVLSGGLSLSPPRLLLLGPALALCTHLLGALCTHH